MPRLIDKECSANRIIKTLVFYRQPLTASWEGIDGLLKRKALKKRPKSNTNVLQQRKQIPYKLNTDEKEQIAKAEREKRRKIRILQVREISRKNAAAIRNAVRLEKLKQLQKLADNINDEFEKSKQQQLEELEANYEKSLRNVGRAHINASKQMEAEDTKGKSSKENKSKAVHRHNAALERLHDDKVRKYIHENKHIIARKAALEKEKERAAKVASLPKPSPGILQDIQQKVYPVILRNENVNQDEIFYPVTTMVKRHHNESVEDGRKAALIQEEKLDEQFHLAKSLAVEREQVAQIRFKKAIDKELLDRDSENVMKELSFLQKKQMKQRQRQLATIPKQVFLPPYKRAEALQDKQRIMEEEFEQFYVGDQMALKNDLSVLLEPHPPVETPSQTDSLDLTITSDIDTSPVKNLPNQSSIMKDITNVSHPPAETGTTKRQTLQTLFDRIKSQRDEWITDMAENLQETEVVNGRDQTDEPDSASPLPIVIESTDNDEDELSDSLTEALNALATKERPQEIVLEETIPVANVVYKMEEIQKRLQQISPTDGDIQIEVLAEDIANGDPASFQPVAIASLLKKQISEVLEQKKRIQEQKKQLEDRLRQFDHQNNASLGGYIFNPPGFPRPPHELSQGLVPSPNDDGSVKDSKNGSENVPDLKILNSGSDLGSLSNSDIEMDLHNLSPNYLADEALKRLPKDITKIQKYQQKIIHQHTERIKRIEEIQMDIQQNRQNLQNSISGIENIPRSDPDPSRIVTADPSTSEPFGIATKRTDDMYAIPSFSQNNPLVTGFHPDETASFLSGIEHKSLPNWNQSRDPIPGLDLPLPNGLSQKSMSSLPAYQSCIQESIAGNLFGPDFHGSVLSMDFQENLFGKKSLEDPVLDSDIQYFQLGKFSVETGPSEPNTPDTGVISKIYDPCAFTPSIDFDSLPTEPIPSSELQEIRKSLPFDETLEDSAQPTPVPSQTVSPYKKSYNEGALSETKDLNDPDFVVLLPSDTTKTQSDIHQIQQQLEEVRKQKEKLCERLMNNQLEQRAKVFERQKQETLPLGLSVNDQVPMVPVLSNPPPKKHPPLIPMAYRYGHSPHELSAIQEKDSSILSSHLSDMHSKLSMSSSFCSQSELAQTTLDPLISGQLLEEKKLWNILKMFQQENLENGSDITLNGNKASSISFATSSPLLSGVKDFSTCVQPSPPITVSREHLSVQPQKPNITEVPPSLATSKTWAHILLERSQQSSESDTEISANILQDFPDIPYNTQILLPISDDTDAPVLRNSYFGTTGMQSSGANNVSLYDRKTTLALSSSLASLHCEPKSSETSSDESRLVSHSHIRDSSPPLMQTQDSSDGSSAANSEFLSMSSLTKDLLQNHEDLSQFLSHIVQTSRRFRSETLQSSPQALPFDTTVQTLQNSTGSSPSPQFSSAISISPSCYNQGDSVSAWCPSTVSDTMVSAGGGESSAFLQLTNTTNQSIMGNGPTLCGWSLSTVDITNQSAMGDAPMLCELFPNTENITNSTLTVDADSKTSSSDDSLISVIPKFPKVDAGKPLKKSSPREIAVSSQLPSLPASHPNIAISSIAENANLNPDGLFETRFSSVCHPSKEFSSSYKVAPVSVSREQIRDEMMQTASSSQAFILPTSTPNLLLKSPTHCLPQLSGPSGLTQSIYVSPISHPNYSVSADVVSPNHQTTPTSSSELTQYSIHTTPESDNVDVSSSSNAQDHLTQKVKEYPGVEVDKFLSSYYSVPLSEGTALPFTMNTMAGMELSKVTESFLPALTSTIAALSLSSSSLSSSPSFPTTLLKCQSTDQNQIRTKESSTSQGTPSSSSSSLQFLSQNGSSNTSTSIPSDSPPDDKNANKSGQPKVLESWSQKNSPPTLALINDQPQSNKSSPVSCENLSLTQYSYTSPETCNNETLPPPGQIKPSTNLSNPLHHQISQKPENQVGKFSNPVVEAINAWQHSEMPGANDDVWMSLIEDVSKVSTSSSGSESFKYAKSSSGSGSSHSGKQGSPEVEIQTKENSSTDRSSRDQSPSFVSLMCNKKTSSDSSDTTPEKSVQKSFQTDLGVDGTVDASAGVSSPPTDLTDSHFSSKIVLSADLSSLSGLSQLSLPSDMMEDYQHLIQQARTLVKRCKADLQEETQGKAYGAGDSGLPSGTALTSAQAFFSDPLAKERDFLSSGDAQYAQATDRGSAEMTECNLILHQIPDFKQFGILDEPNLSLVSSGNDSTTAEARGDQADKVAGVDAGSLNVNSGRIEVKESMEMINPQRLDETSQSRMRSDQTVSDSVAAWKLKYTMGNLTKK